MGREQETDHSTYSAVEDKLERIRGKNMKCLASNKSACYLLLATE